MANKERYVGHNPKAALKQLRRSWRGFLLNQRMRSSLLSRYPDVLLEPFVSIKGPLENLVLGTEVVIQSGTVLHLGGMSWCEDAGHISIGSASVISPNCVIYGCGTGGIHIGEQFDCGPGVGIFSSRTDYKRGPGHHIFAPVVIGDEVTVFANAVIGPGVKVGDRATIGACSVVTRDVPAGSLVMGNPAKVLKYAIRKNKSGS